MLEMKYTEDDTGYAYPACPWCDGELGYDDEDYPTGSEKTVTYSCTQCDAIVEYRFKLDSIMIHKG